MLLVGNALLFGLQLLTRELVTVWGIKVRAAGCALLLQAAVGLGEQGVAWPWPVRAGRACCMRSSMPGSRDVYRVGSEVDDASGLLGPGTSHTPASLLGSPLRAIAAAA